MQQLMPMLAGLADFGGAESAPPITRPPLDQQDSTLFRIPIELREIIYAHVLTSTRKILDASYARWEDPTATALLRTCRRIHHEARLHVHFGEAYVFSAPQAAKTFLASSNTSLRSFNITTSNVPDWTRCETSWFDAWRGFLVPVPGFARDCDPTFDLNTALPRIDTLAIDLTDLSRTIHAKRPIQHVLGAGLSNEEMKEDLDWVYQAGAMNNGLLFILYAMLHALNGVLPRPVWLRTSTVIRIIGLSAVDAITVVEVDVVASVEGISRFIGLAQDRHGYCPSARFTGPGRYLLTPMEEVSSAASAGSVKAVSVEPRRDNLSSPVRMPGTS